MSPKGRLLATIGICAALLGAAVIQLSTGESREPIGRWQRVVVVGVPGLGWSNVDPQTMPELNDLTESAALGSLTTRGASSFACPRDGWVTLGAGNRARYSDADGWCHNQYLPDRSIKTGVVIEANEDRNFGAEPGLLGQELTCVHTYGTDARLAAINAPSVRRASSLPTTAADWSRSWRGCPLALVAGPIIRNGDEAAVAQTDRLIGRIAAAVATEPGTLLLVVGVSDRPNGHPAMHLALAAGDGVGPGFLVSPSTGRSPYVQLIDVAPTVLSALGRERPASMAGRPMSVEARDLSAAEARDELNDVAHAAAAHRAGAPDIVRTWVIGTAAALVAAMLLIRLGHGRRIVRVGMVAVAAFPVATLLSNLVPWWQSDRPNLTWVGCLLGGVVLVTAIALLGPWRRLRYGPAVAVAVVSVVVLAADVVTGSHLQLNGLLGYNPIVAGRFSGFGNMPFAIYAVSGLCALAAVMYEQRPATARWLAVVVGATLVIIDGAPGLGSDFGGVLALVPSVVLLTMIATGIRLSLVRVLGALSAGVAAVMIIAIIDYQRAPDNQTHLGRFVGQLLDGTAWNVMERKAESNWYLLFHSSVALLAPFLLLTLIFLFATGSAPGRRLLREASPVVVGAGVSVATAALLGTLLNDSGVAVFVAAGCVVIPLLLASLPEEQPAPEEQPEPALR